MKRIGPKVGIAAAMLAVAAGSAWGLSPEDKCEADKNKIAGKYAFCRQNEEAKAITKGVAPDYSKCDDKLLDKWGRAEQKAIGQGTECIDSVSDTAIQSFVTAHANAVATALNGGNTSGCPGPASGQTTVYGTGSDGDVQAGAVLSYTDNGDGTITDNNTGLMWEKKDGSGGIHGKDNAYTWTTGTNDMDGTITTTFLATLNSGGGFAGHTDWRIPNAKELQSIVDYGGSSPSVQPAFHQSATCAGCTDVTLASCSCTVASFYWTSTTRQNSPASAWYVYFIDGFVSFDVKTGNRRVRAVRDSS